MQYGKFLFFIFIGAFAISARAQQIDSVLSVYHDKFQQEKVHLHFDKPIYRKEETVWFKAYIMAGNELSDFSRNFYVDFFDANGQLMKHTSYPVLESSAKGSYDIPKNYSGKFIHIRAYTQWMLNFDTSFLYNKNIFVDQPDSNSKTIIEKPITKVHFLPEGGNMIVGVNTNVAFIATNQWGEPVKVSGAILNSKEELIDSFVSVHDGMGVFSLTPNSNETYHCNWVDENGINNISPMPASKINGATIAATQLSGKAIFLVSRAADATENYKQLHVIATINQLEVFNGNINLKIRSTIASEIPTSELPTGILQLTLFDANWIAIAERVLFVNNYKHLFVPAMNILTKGLAKRSKNSIEISVQDTSVLSNLSIAITDAGLVTDNTTTIVSQLLLSSDIKGYIVNPAYYFSSKEDSVARHLDLVMLTHGWRRFKWDDIVQHKFPIITYPPDSDYLQISGKVFNSLHVGTKSGQMITLILQQKSNEKNKQYLFLPLKGDGSFKQRGTIFYDTLKIFYQLSGDKKLTDLAAVSFQNALPKISYAKTFNLLNTVGVKNYHDADSIRLKWNKFINEEYERIKKLSASTTLKDVTVIGHLKSAKEILDETYTSGLFSDNNAYPFDVMNDARAQGSLDLFHYLQNMIPGLTMSLPILGTNGAGDANSNNAPGLNWRDGTPDLFLNEIPTDVLTLQGIQMSDVAYIKVFRPPFMGASGSGASGAIAVYTRKPSDVNTQLIKGLNSATMIGYTATKEFYSPDYSEMPVTTKDVRSTLYWNPYILLDKHAKFMRVEFYNNDISKQLRIVLEGVNAAGKLARVEQIIE